MKLSEVDLLELKLIERDAIILEYKKKLISAQQIIAQHEEKDLLFKKDSLFSTLSNNYEIPEGEWKYNPDSGEIITS
jgi:hypothetical protein